MNKVEIHLINADGIDRKEVLELIHSALIKAGIVKEPHISYGLTNKDKRKYVSFKLDEKVLAFLHQHGTSTAIPKPPASDTKSHKPDIHTTTL